MPAKELFGVFQVLEHVSANHAVECVVSKVKLKLFHVALKDFVEPTAGLGRRLGDKFNADDPCGLTVLECLTKTTGTAAQVEYSTR